MNTYEISYIISPKASEEERDALNSEVDQKIASVEGKVERSSATLRKQLAYPIRKERAGFLRTVDITLSPEHIATIADWFKRNARVLRFTVLNTPIRKEITPETLREITSQEKKPFVRKSEKKESAKEVTMEDVEKGIEDVLTEEVK